LRQDAKSAKTPRKERLRMPYDDEMPPFADLIEPPAELDRIARLVIGAAIEVTASWAPACRRRRIREGWK
jgi:hypothetical protein